MNRVALKKGKIITCAGTGCLSAESAKVRDQVIKEIKERDLEDQIEVTFSGCHGLCEQGPVLVIYPEGIFYPKAKPENIGRIIDSYLQNGGQVEDLLYKDPLTAQIEPYYKEIPFYKRQHRIALRKCGKINPEDINDSLGQDGYQALNKVIKEMSPEEVINEVNFSGIRGRGGAGFPTGKKWEFARNAQGDEKYIICNADEGDPGAFMDRSVLEGDPHSVLEGMIIAGYAIDSNQGIIYVRAEYPLAVERLKIAIKQAEENGLLGDNIFGSSYNFKIRIKEGAGAFVCGEETALIASIEGQRGMPRSKPPFPAISGFLNMPTVINNVETLANIPWIISNGGRKYAEFGTEKSKGTKVFALTGKINRSGLVEVPMGMTLEEIIFDIGGGIEGGKKFKAVQIGGPSGGCIPASLIDTPVDFESLTATGAIMGSGGMVVIDESSCMVDVAKFFLTFTQNESCGKCTTCRLGTKEMLAILTRITEGDGKEEDLKQLEFLSQKVKAISLCALGGTAPNPVLTTLKYFREEYEAHIIDKKCPAGVCKNLIIYLIDPKTCNGCTACLRVCPQGAITGEKQKLHTINQELCSKCGSCYERCRFDAVKIQ